MTDEHDNFDADHERELYKIAKESHGDIDNAIRQHLKHVGVSGIITGWVVISSVTEFDEGAELDGMFATASEGLSKWAKIGLMTVALDQEKDEEYL